MAELRINTTGKLSLFDADDSHAASIVSGTVTANENVMTLATAGVTFSVPTITLGDATAEDTKIVFDGNAQDFYIALDDSADDLLIGLGSTVGTTPIIGLDENKAVTTYGDFTLTGASTGAVWDSSNNSLDFADSTQLRFGAGADLKVYHDGSHSYIVDSGTGNLKIQSSALQIMNAAGDENISLGTADGAVTLYYDNSAKLATTSGGVTVTGDMLLDGTTPTLTIGDAGTEDTMLVFDGNAVDYRMGIDDSADTFDIGIGSTHGTTAQISLSANGVVFNEQTNDYDFRVESDDFSHMFAIDGALNQIGIGNGVAGAGFSTGVLNITNTVSNDRADIVLDTFAANGSPSAIWFRQSRNSTVGTVTETADGQDLGLIYAQGVDSGGNRDYGAFVSFVQSADSGTKVPTDITFGTSTSSATAEKMRIKSNGDVEMGDFQTDGSATGISFELGGSSAPEIYSSAIGTALRVHYQFYNDNGAVGSIKTTSSATQFNTSSDYRLKENVVTDWDATTRLKQLKPSRFNFKADADTTFDGFLAHEVSSIVPEAISGSKDETETKEKVVLNSAGVVLYSKIEQSNWAANKTDVLYTAEDQEVIDGEVSIGDVKVKSTYPANSTWEASKVVPVYQSIDQSKLVPLLVKTIQELEARITVLEG